MEKLNEKEDCRISHNYSDNQEYLETLSEQLQIAGKVQRDFLPRFLPDTDSFKWAATFNPAEVVSGDIYDVARIDEKHIGFYVADVVGHGMPAALLTIFLKQAVKMRETTMNSYKIFSPREVLTNLNTQMNQQKLSGSQFVTCCYGILNIETLELTFARGGHPYPVIIRKDQPPQLIESTGPLIGIFEKTEFSEETIKLEHGDKLLIYSDGAELYFGGYDENGQFIFSDEFSALNEKPIEQWNKGFNQLVKYKKMGPEEVDDVTVVGLEIL